MAASSSFWPLCNFPNGHNMPAVGFGTFRIKDRETIMTVVDASLKAGYRSFDTAAVYGNEAFIGEALKTYLPKHGLTRDDVFITSKLSNSHHGSRQLMKDAFTKSEELLGYTPDLYLIHFPGSARLDPKDKRNRTLRHIAWGAMVELYDSGRVNSIGVSNFTVRHLKDLLGEYNSVIPVVNQVEWHPLYHDEALLEYCNENTIQLQGYHSLGGTGNSTSLIKNALIKQIADRHSVNTGQVLLTWSLQRGVTVIPKSTNPQHIIANIDLKIRLSEDEMNVLNNFTPEQVKFAWDPTCVS